MITNLDDMLRNTEDTALALRILRTLRQWHDENQEENTDPCWFIDGDLVFYEGSAADHAEVLYALLAEVTG